MRIAYVARFDSGRENGVSKKIADQIRIWEKEGHDVAIFATEGIDGEILFRKSLRRISKKRQIAENKCSLVLDQIQDFRPNIVYYRFEPLTRLYIELSKRFKIVLEVNSADDSEYRALAVKSFKKWICLSISPWRMKKAANELGRYFSNHRERKIIFDRADGIVFPTIELSRRKNNKTNKPIIIIPNGIDIERIKKIERSNEERLHLFFMGNPKASLWHGTELMQQLAKALGKQFFIDIVGSSGNVSEGIMYHGYNDSANYCGLVKKSAVAISTLSLYKNNMFEACPLKTREYLAMGLPVIVGYKDTAWGNNPPDFVFRVPNNASWIHDKKTIDELKKFIIANKNRVVKTGEIKDLIGSEMIELRRLRFIESISDTSKGKQDVR